MSDVAGVTHVGRVRKENQDGFIAETFNRSGDHEFMCLAVADGMGGHQNGRLASERAIETIRATLSGLETDPSVDLCVSMEHDAHAAVGKLAQEGETVGTTLTMLLIKDHKGYLAHVGDSRVYRLREGRLVQLTEDQVWDERSEYGLQLRQAIGVGDRVEPESAFLELQDGDRVLVCSDGLHKFVTDEQIEKALIRDSKPQRACDQLLNLALEAGGRDNIAIAIGAIGDVSGESSIGKLKQSWIWVATLLAIGIVLAVAVYAIEHKGF